MFLKNTSIKVWLIQYRIDFRKQHDGLLAEAFKLNLNPYKGDVLIFIGKGRKKIKVLYADQNGLWLSYKKFTSEKMKTNFKFLNTINCEEITLTELALITDGTRFSIEKTVKNYSY